MAEPPRPTGDGLPSAVPAPRASDAGAATDRNRSAGGADDPLLDMVHEWGLQSFPASDPPANW